MKPAYVTINGLECSGVQSLTLYCALQALHEELSARLSPPRSRGRTVQEQLEDRNALDVLGELRVLFTTEPAPPPRLRARPLAVVIEALATLAAVEVTGALDRQAMAAAREKNRSALVAALGELLGEGVAP